MVVSETAPWWLSPPGARNFDSLILLNMLIFSVRYNNRITAWPVDFSVSWVNRPGRLILER